MQAMDTLSFHQSFKFSETTDPIRLLQIKFPCNSGSIRQFHKGHTLASESKQGKQREVELTPGTTNFNRRSGKWKKR